jgi:hypothetical protein
MKKVRVKFTLGVGFPGAEHKDEINFEFDEDATQEKIEEEIEECWKEWMWNYIDGGWEIQ